MRYMILIKGDSRTEAGELPEPAAIAEMADFHEELASAGVLVDASGLQSSAEGFRIRYSGNARSVVDGPFAETKELLAGYTTIRVNSREEALAWARRFPNPRGAGNDAEIEVRRLFDYEDFAPSEAIDRFRELGVGGE